MLVNPLSARLSQTCKIVNGWLASVVATLDQLGMSHKQLRSDNAIPSYTYFMSPPFSLTLSTKLTYCFLTATSFALKIRMDYFICIIINTYLNFSQTALMLV